MHVVYICVYVTRKCCQYLSPVTSNLKIQRKTVETVNRPDNPPRNTLVLSALSWWVGFRQQSIDTKNINAILHYYLRSGCTIILATNLVHKISVVYKPVPSYTVVTHHQVVLHQITKGTHPNE